MSEGTTYDVRVYRTEVYKGSEVTTYWVRWKVGTRLWKEAFRKAAQADSFRSALMTAARKGEAFSLGTGRRAGYRDLPARLDKGSPGGPDRGRAGLTARAAALRPAACLSVHLAEWRRLPHPGC